MSVVKMANMRLNMITECSHLDDIVTPLISNRWVPIEDDLLPNLSRHLRTGLSHIKFVVCAYLNTYIIFTLFHSIIPVDLQTCF